MIDLIKDFLKKSSIIEIRDNLNKDSTIYRRIGRNYKVEFSNGDKDFVNFQELLKILNDCSKDKDFTLIFYKNEENYEKGEKDFIIGKI